MSVVELAEKLCLVESAGVTFTGGEPMDQPSGCIELARRLQRAGKSVVMFTGYTAEKISELVSTDVLRECFDTILAGPYNRALGESCEAGLLRDKSIWHLSGKYGDDDFLALPEAEVIITDHHLVITGLGLPTKRRDRGTSISL